MTSLRVVFGLAVRRLRTAAGYSQEAFAAKCGVHRTYMTDVERGKRNVSLDIIERIAKGLGAVVHRGGARAQGQISTRVKDSLRS
jgi:transcriptional regulator with XRE-family HTH domain